jgi:hypothetical protein
VQRSQLRTEPPAYVDRYTCTGSQPDNRAQCIVKWHSVHPCHTATQHKIRALHPNERCPPHHLQGTKQIGISLRVQPARSALYDSAARGLVYSHVRLPACTHPTARTLARALAGCPFPAAHACTLACTAQPATPKHVVQHAGSCKQLHLPIAAHMRGHLLPDPGCSILACHHTAHEAHCMVCAAAP